MNNEISTPIYSRHTDPTKIHCTACEWKGRVADCIHTYIGVSRDDVEPIDTCPDCGNDEFMEENPENLWR